METTLRNTNMNSEQSKIIDEHTPSSRKAGRFFKAAKDLITRKSKGECWVGDGVQPAGVVRQGRRHYARLQDKKQNPPRRSRPIGIPRHERKRGERSMKETHIKGANSIWRKEAREGKEHNPLHLNGEMLPAKDRVVLYANLRKLGVMQ